MDHRYLSRWVASAMLILSCVACGERESLSDKATGGFPEDHVIRISTEVAPATKGSYTTENITEFDLMVTDKTKPAYTFKNTRFSKSASCEWVPEKTQLWGGEDDKVAIYAIAPCFKDRDRWETGHFYKANPDLFGEVEVEQSEESKKSDYLGYFLNDKTVKDCLTADGKLKIQFEHLLSLVRITFKLGTEFNNEGVPQSNIISDVVISGTKRSFYLNPVPNSGELTATTNSSISASSDVKPYFKKWTSAKDKTGAADKTGNCTSVYECILVPQMVVKGDLKICFKADGKAYEWIAPAVLTFLNKGVHTLTLKVGKDAVIADGFSASEWGDGGSATLETE